MCMKVRVNLILAPMSIFQQLSMYENHITQPGILHGPSMFAVRANIYGVLYNQASSTAFHETSSY